MYWFLLYNNVNNNFICIPSLLNLLPSHLSRLSECAGLGSLCYTEASHWLSILHMMYIWGFPGGSVVKNLPAMQETQEMQVQSLGWEDPQRRKWQPTPVFLPGESHGQRSLMGYRLQRVGYNYALDTTKHEHKCIYVMLLSQFILLTPSSSVSTSLLSASLSLFLPANSFISTIFLDSIYMH